MSDKMLKNPVIIDNDPDGGLRVMTGSYVARQTGCDEALWCVATLLARISGGRVPTYFISGEHQVRQDLRRVDVRAYFAPRDFDFDQWLAALRSDSLPF